VCGRFTLTAPEELLADTFGLDAAPALSPRYNVAPTQAIAVVREPAEGAPRSLGFLTWGSVRPSKGLRRGPLVINVRSEGLGGSSAFGEAFALRRCLVPADGFYEWTGVRSSRRPYYLRLRDGRPFGFAALWEPGNPGSCVILTTGANELVRELHPRMPVILAPDDHRRWLAPCTPRSALAGVCRPYPAGDMTAYPVGGQVGDPRVDTPDCIRRVATLFD